MHCPIFSDCALIQHRRRHSSGNASRVSPPAVLEVLQESDDFTEIGDLLKRHETLKVHPRPPIRPARPTRARPSSTLLERGAPGERGQEHQAEKAGGGAAGSRRAADGG